MINVQTDKTANENNMNLIRRFSRRVRNSGILNRVRSLRFRSRPTSPTVRKKRALDRIEKQTIHDELVKLGKKAPRNS